MALQACLVRKCKLEEPRIGVYVCHCGSNIAAAVDCKEVADIAKSLSGVVLAKDTEYTCSDQTQEEMRRDIREQKLSRVVVASCSPRLHLDTFRRTCEEAGLNKYLFEMANIREHCSWVHLHDRKMATEKAKDLVRMAVAKARLLEPQIELEVPVLRKALVVGGGVAGIQAALDLADTGYEVYLVETAPTIGGTMAQLDKTFPTIDCSICILAPKMSDTGKHSKIKLLTCSEVKKVDGYVGSFKVRVERKPQYVDPKKCNLCDECSKVCPVEVPNEFDARLSWRKAIYLSFPQAVPSTFVLDEESCLGFTSDSCGRCRRVCDREAINYDAAPETIDLEVGTIVVATGAQSYDPTETGKYGYLSCQNVLTSLEVERLVNAGGPTGGRLIRPSDNKIPRSIAFVQCVGSRSERDGHTYCSNICCMNTIKQSLLIKEHWPETEIYVFYMDMRAFGKGFEDLLKRARKEGIKFIRGLPAEILEKNPSRDLRLIGENTLLSELYEIDVELVILQTGLEPRRGSEVTQRLFNLSRSHDGFFLEAHPKLKPVDTPTTGVFLAGCAESPKDIRDSVTQASAAAARAGILMAKGSLTVEAITPRINIENCVGCGLCTKVCSFNAITMNEKIKKAEVVEAACRGCGTCGAECPSGAIEMRNFTDDQVYAQIDSATEVEPEKKIVAFCCNWCSYAGADMAGTSRMQYPTSVRIIRTMCSGRIAWRHIDRAFARRAGIVLVSGCHIGDCHYMNANVQTKKRVEKYWEKMERLGLDRNRLQLGWFSAAEGEMFAVKIKEMNQYLDKVKAEDIRKAASILAPTLKEEETKTNETADRSR